DTSTAVTRALSWSSLGQQQRIRCASKNRNDLRLKLKSPVPLSGRRSPNSVPMLSPGTEIVERYLRAAYGTPDHYNKRDPLGELVFIVLSRQTRESEYRRTFSALWERYRSWDRVRTARTEDIEAAIRIGGLARSKAASLKRMLEKIYVDQG